MDGHRLSDRERAAIAHYHFSPRPDARVATGAGMAGKRESAHAKYGIRHGRTPTAASRLASAATRHCAAAQADYLGARVPRIDVCRMVRLVEMAEHARSG